IQFPETLDKPLMSFGDELSQDRDLLVNSVQPQAEESRTERLSRLFRLYPSAQHFRHDGGYPGVGDLSFDLAELRPLIDALGIFSSFRQPRSQIGEGRRPDGNARRHRLSGIEDSRQEVPRLIESTAAGGITPTHHVRQLDTGFWGS